MTTPLETFLENVEAVINNPDLTNESFGAYVRNQWTRMQIGEQITADSRHVVINQHGYPVHVAVPQEG